MKDYIIRATAFNDTIRAFAAITTNIVQTAKDMHDTSPVATAALGRTLTAASIMGCMLKNKEDTATIQIRGDGPLGGIIAVTTSDSKVRGYVYNPQVYLPLNEKGKLDVGGAVGKNGYLNVIKDLGLKEPYIGYVKLVSGEIAEDMAYYMTYSEQIPSVVALGVLINPDGNISNAGGFVIQAMPGADDSVVERIEKNVLAMPPVTAMLSEGNTPENILQRAFDGESYKIIDTVDCEYKCNCSRERMTRNLISLGRDEILDIINEQHEAQLECHFCNKKYHFTEEELRALIENR